MDANLSEQLGLKKFWMDGSCGIERIGLSVGTGVIAGAGADADAGGGDAAMDARTGGSQDVGKDHYSNFNSNAWDEKDVLLMGGGSARGVSSMRMRRGMNGNGNGNGNGNDPSHNDGTRAGVDMVQKDGVCYKVLAWIFEW